MSTPETIWRARFERFGRTYSEDHHVSGWSAVGLQRRLALFAALLNEAPMPARGRVLELGCGAGTYVRYLSARRYDVVGMDYALSSLARAVAAEQGRDGHYVAGDGYALPFRGASFDMVLCIGVLQVLSRPRDLIVEVARVLRPGGVVVVEALNPYEVPAATRLLLERAGVRAPRLSYHAPRAMQLWLERAGLEVSRRVPLCLPPRRLPWLGSLLDGPILSRVLRAPRMALPLVHAFWFLARRA